MRIIIIIFVSFLTLIAFAHQIISHHESCCKGIVQRYYLHGKLVHVQEYDSIITERGCLNYFSVKGKNIWADSIVTTLK